MCATFKQIVFKIKHPNGVNCLRCGFLGKDDIEIGTADRILLDCQGAAGLPNMNNVRCVRNLWVNLTLSNNNFNINNIINEVKRKRKYCEGYFKYKPGWNPEGHKDLLLRNSENKIRLWFMILGGIVALIVEYIIKHCL